MPYTPGRPGLPMPKPPIGRLPSVPGNSSAPGKKTMPKTPGLQGGKKTLPRVPGSMSEKQPMPIKKSSLRNALKKRMG